MAVAPANIFSLNQDQIVVPIVKIAGEETKRYRCVQVTRALGSRGSFAVLVKDLQEDENRIRNKQIIAGADHEVEVWLPTPVSVPDVCIFSGKTVAAKVVINDQSEQVQITCRDTQTLYGDPILGSHVWDGDISDYRLIDEDPVFHPSIDGEVEFNRHNDPMTDGNFGFVDPESVRTQTAMDYNNSTGQEWTLEDAVDYFHWTLNADENWLTNPAVRTLGIPAAVPLRDITISRGTYLPEVLDQLLFPHGYTWFLKLESTGSGLVRKIGIVKRGQGTKKKVRLQLDGGTYQRQNSSMYEGNVEFNIADMVNKVVAHGAPRRREVTIELYPAWPEAQDELTVTELQKSDPDSSYREFPHAWRLWVANEAGDWGGYRDVLGSPIPDVLDLSSVFGSYYVPRRRVFEQCISVRREGGKDGDDENAVLDHRPRPWPVYVEYYDNNDSLWKGVSGGYIVRNDQLAIEFTGDTPPQEIRNQWIDEAQFPQLRVTAAITGDERIKAEKTFSQGSPTSQESVLFLDVGDRFFDDLVIESGAHASEIASMTPDQPTLERDDLNELQEFVDQISDLESAAVVGGSLNLFELRSDYDLGDVVTMVSGRKISLNRYTGAKRNERFPQITAITWDCLEQKTILELESLDEDE